MVEQMAGFRRLFRRQVLRYQFAAVIEKMFIRTPFCINNISAPPGESDSA